MPAFAGMTARYELSLAYFTAEKRPSNEFADTIGWAPATRPSFAGGAAAASESVTDGFSGGWAAACLVSAFGAAAFGIDASGRDGSFRLASMTFGFAGIGCALAVVSAAAPPSPILRARLLKIPSDWAFGAADATRVTAAGA